MLTSKDRLALMVKGLPKSPAPRHCLLAVEVLTGIARELQKQDYRYSDDSSWPYHILAPTSPGRNLSFFCGGFSKVIDIQQLKSGGTVDARFKEVRLCTPRGAVNYLRRRLS